MHISAEYREQNKKLHETNEHYGVSSAKWGNEIKQLAGMFKVESILDYGCGKGELRYALGLMVLSAVDYREYDPAIEGKDAIPEPADLVVCTDVLEHIEPEYLDAVLDDLQRLTKKSLFITVDTRPAKKTLADGRNAHLIQETEVWWLPKLMQRFRLLSFNGGKGKFIAVLENETQTSIPT